MASRYWVGGTDNWNATAGSKWATTSGGAGGSAVPTSSDDVFFDANSGAVTVTKTVNGDCLSLDCSNFTGTLKINDSISLNVFGNLTLGSAMTLNSGGGVGTITFSSTSTGKTITTNGVTAGGRWNFNGVGGGWTLQDSLTMNTPTSAFSILLTAGTLDTNNKSIDVSSASATINISGTTARTLTLGSSVISGLKTWTATTTTNLTFNANSSSLNFGGVAAQTFAGGGLTYNNVSIGVIGSTATISGSNTFNILTIMPFSVKTTVNFTAGTTQTVTNLVNQGNTTRNVLQSTSAGSAWTISCASETVVVTNASLQDSTATGGAAFRALGTTNVSGNSGWVFSEGVSGFFAFM